MFLARFGAGLRQLCLLEYEIPPELYEQPWHTHPWNLQLDLLLAAYPLFQFLLGVATIAGLLFLFDIRTRRVGIAIALPPLLADAVSWWRVEYLPLKLLPWVLFTWMLWLSLRPRSSFGASERAFYLTPATGDWSRTSTLLIVLIIAISGVARQLVLKPGDNGARSLAGTRTANHRGAWTYEANQSNGAGLPNEAFDIYFWPYGPCHSKIRGAKFEGRLLSEYYGRNIYLDCLPNNVRLHATFKIEGETLTMENQ